jgi:hypothetical protein
VGLGRNWTEVNRASTSAVFSAGGLPGFTFWIVGVEPLFAALLDHRLALVVPEDFLKDRQVAPMPSLVARPTQGHPVSQNIIPQPPGPGPRHDVMQVVGSDGADPTGPLPL